MMRPKLESMSSRSKSLSCSKDKPLGPRLLPVVLPRPVGNPPAIPEARDHRTSLETNNRKQTTCRLWLGDGQTPVSQKPLRKSSTCCPTLDIPSCWSDLWAPSSRTNFVRITLSFPDENAHISQLLTYQNSIIAALKSKSFRSGIEGTVELQVVGN